MSGIGTMLTCGDGMLAMEVWSGAPGTVGEDVTAVLA